MSKNRKCRNRAPHDAHVWKGLNTRGDGYQCPGVPGVYRATDYPGATPEEKISVAIAAAAKVRPTVWIGTPGDSGNAGVPGGDENP